MKDIFSASVCVTVFFLLAYIGCGIVENYSEPTIASNMRVLKESIGSVSERGWLFASPLLQLVIVLLVLEWFANRIGVNVKLGDLRGNPDVQILIAVFIIGSYCIAVLGGIPGSDNLKEIALIVVGFYFGSRKPKQSIELPASNIQKNSGSLDTPSVSSTEK